MLCVKYNLLILITFDCALLKLTLFHELYKTQKLKWLQVNEELLMIYTTTQLHSRNVM